MSEIRLSCRTVVFLVLAAVVVGIAGGILGWIWVTGGSGEASRSVEEALAEREANNAEMIAAVNAALADAAATIIPAAVNTAVAAVADAVMVASESEPVEFAIVSAESQATFTLEEDLRGSRTTVVGSTSDVGGSMMVDLENPSASSIGTIVVNARTLETDNSFRNRALRSDILKSAQDAYEFIFFEPRSLSNFSAESVSVGDTLSFDITGDLSIADVTRSVTFAASVTLESETRIRGSASANVLYADYNLVIPQVPSVANVTDDVDLAIHFVATAGG